MFLGMANGLVSFAMVIGMFVCAINIKRLFGHAATHIENSASADFRPETLAPTPSE